jgi:hypothetical protein
VGHAVRSDLVPGDRSPSGVPGSEQGQGAASQPGSGRPSANPGDAVSALLEGIRRLVLEREQLRDRGASREDLEANRLAIVREQWRLTKAAAEAHASHDEAKAA